MKSLKNANFKKILAFAKRPKVIIWAFVLALLVYLATLTFFIYSKDRPAYIPEDIRENVRGAIVEKIGQPLQQISNPAGTFIINAAYQKANSYAYGHNKKDTKNWPEYTDPETGLTFSYPEGWEVEENSYDLIRVFDSVLSESEGEYPQIIISFSDTESDSLNSWLSSNKQIFIGEQLEGDVLGFTNRVTGKINSYDYISFYYENMGKNKVTVIDYKGKILTIEGVLVDLEGLSEIYEEIIKTIR